MSLAEQLNIGFTVAAMNPNRGRQEVEVKGDVVMDLRKAGKHPAPLQGPVEAESDVLRRASLEYQFRQYRAFRLFDGALLHSHECKVEAIRRTERDGYIFTIVQGV